MKSKRRGTTTSSSSVHSHVQPKINNTESTLLWQTMQEYFQYGLFVIMEVLAHLWSYLATPGVVLTHVMTCILFYSLTRKGVGVKEVIRAGILQEVFTYVLWCCLPNTLGTVFALYLTIHLYETLQGPKVVIRKNGQLLVDDDIRSTLYDTCPGIKFECIEERSGFRINTFLQYIAHSRIRWRGDDANKCAHGIRLCDISTVHNGYDYDISRTIRSLGANSQLCFYVTLADDNTTVTFVANDVQTREQWLTIFRHLCCTTVGNVKSLWFEKACKQAGILRQNGEIQFDQVESILTAAQRLTDKSYLAELIKAKNLCKMGTNETLVNALTLDTVFDSATFMPEIEIIFEKILQKQKNGKVLETSGFCQFLNDEQKEDGVDLNAARRWVKEYETVLPSCKLTTIGFTNYMMSDRNSVFYYKHREVYQDMTQPLSHYFISTSHNTYLTKDQLKSKSSVEQYINALKRGCRCVELDTWDGPNNEPVIYHGRTLTSKIVFKDVITAVNDHAFTASPYPVILSFENHCSVEQQKVIASHLISILGGILTNHELDMNIKRSETDKLYTKPIPDDEKQYPSPNDLKGYVIVKYKKLKAGQDLAYDEYSDDDDNDDNDEPSVQLDDENEDDEDAENEKKKGSVKSIMDVMKGIKGKKGDKKKDEIPKIAQELSDLVIYCQSVHFKDFYHSKEKDQYFEMSSIGEKKALKLIKEDPPAFLQYCTRQICRTYPAGNRIDSSNYDPHYFWNIGAQMVALNFQTQDRPMQLYQGLYQDNGGCGYILKPDFMRIDGGFDPRGPFSTCKSLNIQVISGRQLPYSNEKQLRSERSLSVLIRISGVEVDCAKDKTKIVKNNGFNVIWNEMLKFKVHVPELAMLQFTVREGNDSFLGHYTLPVRCMQQGYRNVPLLTKSSLPVPHASLFIMVDIGEAGPVQ